MRGIVSAALILSIGCCREETVERTTDGNIEERAQRTEETPTQHDLIIDSRGTALEAGPKSAQLGPLAASGNRLAVGPLLPRPIKTDLEAQECLKAAEEQDRQIAQLTGIASDRAPKLLKNCVVQYDDESRGYTRFYPGRTCARLSMRGSGIADLNVSVRSSDVSRLNVIHIRIDDTSMIVDCHETVTGRTVTVSLFRSSGSGSFVRSDTWEGIADPDVLEAFCMEVYHDFQLLRRE